MPLTALRRLARWLITLTVLGVVVPVAAGDEFIPRSRESYFSANKRFKLTVEPERVYLSRLTAPGESWNGERQLWLRRQSETPSAGLVSDDGQRIVTFGTWGRDAVVVRGPSGSLVARYGLIDLLAPDEIDEIPPGEEITPWLKAARFDSGDSSRVVLTVRRDRHQPAWPAPPPPKPMEIRLSLDLVDGRIIRAAADMEAIARQQKRCRGLSQSEIRSGNEGGFVWSVACESWQEAPGNLKEDSSESRRAVPSHQPTRTPVCGKAVAWVDDHPAEARRFGAVSTPERYDEKNAQWQEFGPEDVKREEDSNLFYYAQAWRLPGGSLFVRTQETSFSGDWGRSVDYCYSVDGRLLEIFDELRMFPSHAITRQVVAFDEAGRETSRRASRSDLETDAPLCQPAAETAKRYEAFPPRSYRNLGDLPFWHLLKQKATTSERRRGR